MTKTFEAQVGDQVRLVDRRLIATFRNGAFKVIEEAQKPRGQGGRMPVQTGFLRNSGRANLGDMPKGQIKGSKKTEYEWKQEDTLLIIGKAEPGDLIFFGWTAVYARGMEQRYGFQRGAAEKWQEIIEAEASRAKELIK